MPTYDYECPNGHRHERPNVRYTDREPRICPECGEQAARQISLPQRPLNTGTPLHHPFGKL